MARSRRLERLTHSLEGCCSIQLSYERVPANTIVILPSQNNEEDHAVFLPIFDQKVCG